METTPTFAKRRRVVAALVLVQLFQAAPAVAEDFRDGFPQILTMSPYGVNLQTGRFELREADLTIGPLTAERRYSSVLDNTVYGFATASADSSVRPKHPAFGIARNLRGLAYLRTVKTSNGSFEPRFYVEVEGQRLEFNTVTGGTIINWGYETKGWRLSRSGNDLLLDHKSGSVYRFIDHAAITSTGENERPRVLTSVIHADGRRLDYSYGTMAELRSVSSGNGYRLNFDYDAGNSRIVVCGYNAAAAYVTWASGCGGAAHRVIYQFGPNSIGAFQVTAVTRPDNSVTNLNFAGRYLTCVTLPNSNTCRVTNSYGQQPGEPVGLTKVDQVRVQTLATGEVWNYVYDDTQFSGDALPLGPRDLPPDQQRYTYTVMTDPLNRNTEVQFFVGSPNRVISPEGETRYVYSATQPIQIIYQEQNKLTFSYDDNANNVTQIATAKTAAGPEDITLSRTFYPARSFFGSDAPLCSAVIEALCDKPLTQTDARGFVTNYTYDPDHGGIRTLTEPAVNGVRAQKRYEYVQRFARVMNESGGYSPSHAVWLVARERSCRRTAASGPGCAGGSADEVITEYDYGPDSGPNNLLVRGHVVTADGQALRTCYGYDVNGRKISETGARAGLATCP